MKLRRPEVLKGLEERGFADEAQRIVLLSGCPLNNASVLRRLGAIFHGYEGLEEGPPAAIVLIGPFFERPAKAPLPSVAEMRGAFAALASVLAMFPKVMVRLRRCCSSSAAWRLHTARTE